MLLLRLFGAGFVVALQRGLAFRADLCFQAVLTVVGTGAGLAALGVVYTQTATLGGWHPGEAVVLLGTYQIVSGLRAAFVEPNVLWFGGQVKEGKLDDLLLKPAPSLFLATLGTCAPLALMQVVVGGAVLLGGLRTLGTLPTLQQFAAWLELVGCGSVLAWASRVLVACLVFWSPGIALDVVYGALWQFGRYPVSIYRRPLRAVLTFALPVAFVATVPAQALTRGVGGHVVEIGLVAAVASVVLTRFVWRRGLLRYTSATA